MVLRRYDTAQIRQLRATLGRAAIAKRLGIARSSVYRALGVLWCRHAAGSARGRPLLGLFGLGPTRRTCYSNSCSNPSLSEVASRCPDVAHVWIGRLARRWCAHGAAGIRRASRREPTFAGAGLRPCAMGEGR
jgi:hypothetical protein